MEKLVDRWICNSDQYINEDQICFVDYNGKHYKFTSAQQEAWANAIPTGRQAADVKHPPADMYDYLRNKQGPVTNRSKNPVLAVQKQKKEDDRKATLSAFHRIIELTAKREELRIMRDFGSERKVLNPPHTPYYPMYQQPPPPWPLPYQYPIAPFAQHQQAVPAPPPPQPVATAPSQASQSQASDSQASLSRARVHDRSSPIAPKEEDNQILADFFHCKKRLVHTRPDIQRKLATAYETIIQEMWSVEDVKDISDKNSRFYKRAMALHMPHGLVTSFQDQLSEFKHIYRSEYAASRQLATLARAQQEARAQQNIHQGGELDPQLLGGFIR